MRRSSVTSGLKSSGTRRRSNAGYTGSTGVGRRCSGGYTGSLVGRRCSLSTFTATSRIRSNSRGQAADDDTEISQPSLEDLPLVTGYEDITFEPCTVPPPNLPEIPQTEMEEEIKEYKEIPSLSPAQARLILIRHADSRCIFNKDAARDMKITAMDYQPRYKYTLESYTESREIAWCSEPYSGENLDEFGSSHSIPSPWSIEVQKPPSTFQLHTITETVPHTDVLMTCHTCGGVGSKRCNACSAAGWERCSFCLGDGHKISLQGHRERCFRCLGTGRKKCWKCGGDTIAVCRGCGGTGQVRCFIAITVTWSNHSDTRTIETPDSNSAINHKLEFVKGITVFEEEKPLVFPNKFPENEEIQSLSASLINKHEEHLQTEKLILQRHSISTIPVYCLNYEWKQRGHVFFVYGSNNEVYAPNYPEELCCCCLLM